MLGMSNRLSTTCKMKTSSELGPVEFAKSLARENRTHLMIDWRSLSFSFFDVELRAECGGFSAGVKLRDISIGGITSLRRKRVPKGDFE